MPKIRKPIDRLNWIERRAHESKVYRSSDGMAVKEFKPHTRFGGAPESPERMAEWKAHFYAFKLAHFLFPEHVIDVKSRDWTQMPGIQSSKIEPFDAVYEAYRKRFYRAHKTQPQHVQRTGIPLSDLFVKKLAEHMEEAGIHLDVHPVNIGFVQGRPVFIELDTKEGHRPIDEEKVRAAIERTARPESEKTMARTWLARYNALQSGEAYKKYRSQKGKTP